MPTFAGVLSKVNKALRKVNGSEATVYKRVYSTTGGDAVLGRGMTTSYTDAKVTPAPVVYVPTGEDAALASGGMRMQVGDIMALFSSSAVSKSDLTSKSTTFVFVDGSEEVEYQVGAYMPAIYDGGVIVFNVLLVNKRR